MSEDDLPRAQEEGGSLLATISNEFVQMQKQYWGLGPVKVKSYMMDDLLLIVMRGGLTRAEHTMLEFDEQDLVRGFRQTFENNMTQRLQDKVERLTGRKVLTYQSQILFDPDIVAELFVFDRAAPGAEEIVATAKGQLDEESLGEGTGETGASTSRTDRRSGSTTRESSRLKGSRILPRPPLPSRQGAGRSGTFVALALTGFPNRVGAVGGGP